MKWILEKDVFSENLEPLREQIERQGMTYEIVEYIPFGGGDYTRFTKDDFFYGCLEFGERLRKESSCTIYHTKEHYLCSYYYPRFGNHLFNKNYMMLPYGELNRRQEFLFNTFGSGEYCCIHLRPSDGEKTFTGMVVGKDTYSQDIEFIERYSDVPPETLCVVSPAQNIAKEYRFIVSGKKVVTGSLYKIKDALITELINEDHEAFKFAQKIVDEIDYNPDPMWTLDIVVDVNDNWAVLEVGCFSSAGWYASNVCKILEAFVDVNSF